MRSNQNQAEDRTDAYAEEDADAWCRLMALQDAGNEGVMTANVTLTYVMRARKGWTHATPRGLQPDEWVRLRSADHTAAGSTRPPDPWILVPSPTRARLARIVSRGADALLQL